MEIYKCAVKIYKCAVKIYKCAVKKDCAVTVVGHRIFWTESVDILRIFQIFISYSYGSVGVQG